MFFYPSNYDGKVGFNTVQYRFSYIYEVSQRLSTSLPYAGKQSLYRRAFQNNLASILHYLLHILTLLSSISRATGKIFAMWCRHCKLVSKIPILPCSLGLWAFCFSFDNVSLNSCMQAHGLKRLSITLIWVTAIRSIII